MRICILSTYLPQQCGIATYTDYLIHGLKRVDKDIKVLILAEKEAEKVEEDRLKVNPCWSRKEDYVSQILENLEEVDVIHMQHEYSIWRFDERLPHLTEELSKKAKLIITMHCVHTNVTCDYGRDYGVEMDMEEFNRKFLSPATKVILHLDECKKILEREGVPSEKLVVIPHGSEIQDVDTIVSRKHLNLPEKGFIILLFGFVRPHKKIHIVIEAMKEIVEKKKDVYLFIAGGAYPRKPEEHPYVKMCENLIKDLGLEENVIFPNRFLPNEDVPYIFGASDLVLFPYYEDYRSASGAFHLAMGAGKPVIASRIPKFEELANVSPELLILPEDKKALCRLILRLVEDEKFYREIKEKTKEYGLMTSWDNVAKKHLEVYK